MSAAHEGRPTRAGGAAGDRGGAITTIVPPTSGKRRLLGVLLAAPTWPEIVLALIVFAIVLVVIR